MTVKSNLTLVIKTLDFSSLLKAKNQIKRISQTVFHKKEWPNRYKYLFLGWDKSYFVKKKKKNTLILPKSSLKLILSNCLSFWLTTYLLCLLDLFFNRQSAYLWIHTVLLLSLTYSFIRTRQTSYRGFSRKFIKS